MAPDLGSPMVEAVRRFHRRNALMGAAGLPLDEATFAGVFGRQLEYYTGFVFQIEAADPDGRALAIAGGGRYDRLLSDIRCRRSAVPSTPRGSRRPAAR